MYELLADDNVPVLNDDDVALVIILIASFGYSFERVFLKGTQRHGRMQVSPYNTWRQGMLQAKENWRAIPQDTAPYPNVEVELTWTRMLVDSTLLIFNKH